MKRGLLFVSVICVLGAAVTSCADYKDEPPRVVDVDDYLIPSAETPTAEESDIAKAIRQEYDNFIGQ